VRKDLRLEARKERLTREGFTTGLDLTCEQEAEKRRERASRFNIPLEQDPLSYAPDPAGALVLLGSGTPPPCALREAHGARAARALQRR